MNPPENMPDTQIESVPGVSAFNALRAEDDPWLEACFVPPLLMDDLLDSRSVVVFGRPGYGKTALSYALQQWEAQAHNYLLARWKPTPLSGGASGGIEGVQEQVRQVFDACAESILRYLAVHPQAYQNASPLTQEALRWFLHRFSREILEFQVEQLIDDLELTDASVLQSILTPPAREILQPGAPAQKITRRLIKTLNKMGLRGVWIVVDDVELGLWLDNALDELVDNLSNFLSALFLFEGETLGYKLFLPEQLKPRLGNASAILRRRVHSYTLTWTPETLQTLLETRLQLATAGEINALNALHYNPQELMDWLKDTGADSPRAWLAQLQPLVRHYLNAPPAQRRPVNAAEWTSLRQSWRPELRFDAEHRRVCVGGKEIPLEKFSKDTYNVLNYLYRHKNKIVSRQELYFLAYREMNHLPVPGESDYEALNEYRGVIDNIIWKLRGIIELDSSNPTLLITVRGHGVKLMIP